MTSQEILYRLNACRKARGWIGDRTPCQAWRSCNRGDWLLWIADKLNIDRKLIVLAACDCAETALRYVSGGEDRPRKAIAMARLWCDGKAPAGEVRAAARAAYAAALGAYADADYAAAYAAYAAHAAAAYAARAAARAAGAPYDAAAYAADANADADAYADVDNRAAAYDAARAESRQHSATLVRKRIPWRVVKKGIISL